MSVGLRELIDHDLSDDCPVCKAHDVVEMVLGAADRGADSVTTFPDPHPDIVRHGPRPRDARTGRPAERGSGTVVGYLSYDGAPCILTA